MNEIIECWQDIRYKQKIVCDNILLDDSNMIEINLEHFRYLGNQIKNISNLTISMQAGLQKSAEDWKNEGNQSFKKKNYEEAIRAYDKAIQLNDKQPSYYSNRAICQYYLGKYLQCISSCNESLKYNPNLQKALTRKAMAHIELLNFDQAIAAYAISYSIDKNIATNNDIEMVQSYKSNYIRYFAHMEKQQFQDALKCVNYLVNKIPKNQKLKMYKVESLAKTGDTQNALTLIKTIPIANTSNPDFWHLMGIIELYGGRSQKAKNCFSQGLRLDPDNQKCRVALTKAKKCQQLKQQGNELIKNFKYEQAQQKYTQAINLDPANKKMNSIIYSNRAQTWIKRKQNIKALSDLNKSLQLDPEYTRSLMRRAEIYMERKQYTAAIMDYSKIQQVDPTTNLKPKIAEAKKKEKQAKKKDYYKILQVDRNASQAEIKKSYKRLALEHHPDRNRGKTHVEQQQASKKFKQIAQAYGVLTDPKKKQLYDSGQIQYDGDQGMGGMNINPQQIFKVFFQREGGFNRFQKFPKSNNGAFSFRFA